MSEDNQPSVVTTIVTKREDTVPHSTGVLETPGSIPSDIRVVAMSAVRIIVVRSLRVFGQAFMGGLTAGGVGTQLLNAGSGGVVKSALILAASSAAFTAIQNAVELLAKFDESHPQFRA